MTMWIDLTFGPSPEERGGFRVMASQFIPFLTGFMNRLFETSTGFLKSESIRNSSVPLSFGEGLGVRSWHIRHDWFYSIRSGCWK